jgi:arginyl-tRNA--protein-N-Asp/Glu arginylyltransferase
MLNPNIHFLTEARGTTLDKYLAAGWYRIYDLMFTTDSITVDTQAIPVKWIRYGLQQLEFRRSARKLLARNRKKFKLAIIPYEISLELEELYLKYWFDNQMEMSPSIGQSMFVNDPSEVFDTKLMELRLEGRLVAAGYFDLGRDSAAGIINFFDPDHKRDSLGKYLMLEAVDHCRQAGMRYFYPGYIAEGWDKFDYKLSVGTGVEIFSSGKWAEFSRD